MSDIFYNFAGNYDALGDISHAIQDVTEVKQDIAQIFNALSVAYEGQGATALQEAHTKLDNALDDALYHSTNSQQVARDQQDAMQDLDRANAAQF